MAGKENQESRADVRFMKWWEKKSLLVGGVALGVWAFFPSVAPIAIRVAAFEGLQWGGAKAYENRVKNNGGLIFSRKSK